MAALRGAGDPRALASGVLAGDRLSIARALSLVENHPADAPALLAALYPHSGRAHIVGVTGAPGTGKSTLVTALARSYRAAGCTVAIVAVDPTSPFSGGALLGDRVRMRALSGDEGVFIRSMASRGSLGGLAQATGDGVTVLDAAGYQRILVETVGVGQAEVAVAAAAHTTLVVEAPGLGDEVQAIKAGILEIADLLVMNKADRPGADHTARALALALDDSHPPQDDTRWRVPLLKTAAGTGEGVEALREQVEAHYNWLARSGALAGRERRRAAQAVRAIVHAELERRIAAAMPAAGWDDLLAAVSDRRVDPHTAARRLLGEPPA